MGASISIPEWVRMLIAASPVILLTLYGVYLVWKSERWPQLVRTALTAIAALLVLGMLGQVFGVTGSYGGTTTDSPDAKAGTPGSASQEALIPLPLPAEELQQAKVVKIIDADTLEVVLNDTGETETVGLIGVDAPESTYVVDAAGREAAAYTSSNLQGKTVYLETDLELRDTEKRMLAYVWLADPAQLDKADVQANLFNAKLLLDGQGRAVTTAPNMRYAEYLKTSEAEARDANRGLWSDTDDPTLTPAEEPLETKYIANSKTHKFHAVGCYWITRINPEDRVPYHLRSACIADGYIPCKTCNP